MRKIKEKIGDFIYNDVFYIIINYFIAYIPFWTIRKALYQVFGMKIGNGTRIAMRCVVIGQKGCRGIVIGEDNVINEYCLLDGRSGLEIGNSNSISMYTKIYSGTHRTHSENFEYIGRKTILHNNTWIGTSAIILPGSEINDFSVISANSLFNGTTEEKGIYMGVPAVLVKYRRIECHYRINFHSFFR